MCGDDTFCEIDEEWICPCCEEVYCRHCGQTTFVLFNADEDVFICKGCWEDPICRESFMEDCEYNP